VKAKLIALDVSQRKIGLSVKALTAGTNSSTGAAPAKAPAKKAKSLDDVEAPVAEVAPKKAATVVEEAAE
jgi:ribosomal protein S1